MPSDLVSQATFARMIGVTKQTIGKAVRVGRIPVYDEAGQIVRSDYTGRKLIKPSEASAAFRLSRARIDDAQLAETQAAIDEELSIDPEASGARTDGGAPISGSLANAKTESEQVKAELLRMRLARERGELVSRAAQLEAFEIAGGKIARMLNGVQFWAEDLTAVAHKGGVAAVSALLRDKSADFLTRLADTLQEPSDREEAIDLSDAAPVN